MHPPREPRWRAGRKKSLFGSCFCLSLLLVTLTTTPARADIAPSLPTPKEARAIDREPGDEENREACFNEKALPWLPSVALPFPGAPGAAALAFRPREALREHPRQVVWLSAGVLSLGLAAFWRKRPLWRSVAVLLALVPAVVGVAEAQQLLARLREGLSLPFHCVPREGVFQRHAQLARDALAAGYLASLGLLLIVGVLASVLFRPRRGREFFPVALSVLLLALGGVVLQAREGELALQVNQPLAPLSELQLPAAIHTPPGRIPDVPLLLVKADGQLLYDDSRGQRPPQSSPLLLPFDSAPLSSDPLDRPPFFLLAVDGRVSWEALFHALDPIFSRGYQGRQWLLFGPATAVSPGAPPRAPAVVFWRPDIEPSPRRKRSVWLNPSLIGWVEAGSLRLEQPDGELPDGCKTPGGDHLLFSRLAGCIEALEDRQETSPRDPSLLLVPLPSTPWESVARLLDELARPRPERSSRLASAVGFGVQNADLVRRRREEKKAREDMERQLIELERKLLKAPALTSAKP